LPIVVYSLIDEEFPSDKVYFLKFNQF